MPGNVHKVASFGDPNVERQIVGLVRGQNATVKAATTHAAATTGVHGVGASSVESTAGAQAKADAVQANLNTHAGRTDNPHAVTAAQVGAVSKAGDTMTGPLTIANGLDLHLKAAAGSTDSGDIVFEDGNGAEVARIWQASGQLNTRFNVGPTYKIWDAGNLNINRWVQPGSTILLEALTERSASGSPGERVKAFCVIRPGRYRITGEARISGSACAYVYVEMAPSGEVNSWLAGSFSTSSTSYVAFTIDLPKPIVPGGMIYVRLASNDAARSAYIRNVRVQYADAPELVAEVILN